MAIPVDDTQVARAAGIDRATGIQRPARDVREAGARKDRGTVIDAKYMTWIRHAIIASLYVSLAALTFFGVMMMGDGDIATVLAIVSGGLVLLAGALTHESVMRRRRDRSTQRNLDSLGAAYEEVRLDLTQLRNQIFRPQHTKPAHARPGAPTDDGEVMGEVRVLQHMVERISKDRHAEDWEDQGRHIMSQLQTVQRLPLVPRPRPVVLGGPADRQIMAILQDALRRDRFDLFLQPIYRLPQQRVAFHECFCYVRGNDGRYLTPNLYASVAEESGLITAVDNLLATRTVQMVRSAMRRNRDHAFFCSVSGFTLGDQTFLDDLVEILENNAGFASKLVLQFAQADIDALGPRLRRYLGPLARAGYRFCMNRVQYLDIDYQELCDLNFRYVKLPVPLLLVHKQQAPDQEDLRILRHTVDRYAIDLIAEELDHEDQVKDLIDYAIDLGQGRLPGLPRLAPGEQARIERQALAQQPDPASDTIAGPNEAKPSEISLGASPKAETVTKQAPAPVSKSAVLETPPLVDPDEDFSAPAFGSESGSGVDDGGIVDIDLDADADFAVDIADASGDGEPLLDGAIDDKVVPLRRSAGE